ncbi:MAG: zinc ribbon domain-containing protein [Pseudomonadota bacterium]|nr:zinc ribbon domain-containing protein [Pseudomonadota bacterium]
MPIYDYCCPDCGPFTALRAVAQRDADAACPVCGAGAERTLLAAPALPLLSDTLRRAHATNERSSHEPGTSRTHRHGPGCGCSAKPGRESAPQLKSFAAKRPWMISH